MTDALEGFNQWTVPWTTPEGPELDAARAGTLKVPQFDLSDAQATAYQRDGIIYLAGAFSDWVEPLRAGLARNLADTRAYRFPAESTREGEAGRFFDSYCNWTLIPEYRDFVFNSAVGSLAGRAMKARYAQFFHEHVFVKGAGTRHPTPWHQDIPYYCVDGDQSVSVYVALDDIDEEVAVRFIRGSHLWGKVYYPKVWLSGEDFNVGDEGYSDTIPDISAEPEKYDIASWALAAGDALLFNFKTVHGTEDRILRRSSRAFSTRWMGERMYYLERPGETSPPFVDSGMKTGDTMREDWFPIVWRRPASG